MREACEVINAYWFETLGRPIMQVPKAVGNHASRKVSAHEGMRMIATQQGAFVCGPLLKEVWEMTTADWLENKQPLGSYEPDDRKRVVPGKSVVVREELG